MRKIVFALALAACAPQPKSASGYTATILDLPAGAVYAGAYAVNDSGVATGRGWGAEHFAVRWTRTGAAVRLKEIPGETASTGNDINNAGSIVGSATDGQHRIHATVWNGDSIIYLPDLGAGAAGTGVNEAGVITGYALVGGQQHAARWDHGVIREIHPAGYLSSRGRDVNELGDIVGWAFDGRDTVAYLWSADGSQHVLGVLPGTPSSDVHGVNNTGMIIGSSTDGVTSTALTWTSANGLQSAGFGGTQSVANQVSDKGRIVGWSSTGAAPSLALARLGAVLDTLPDPLGGSAAAYDVNACGTIVGSTQGASLRSLRAVRWSKPSCD